MTTTAAEKTTRPTTAEAVLAALRDSGHMSAADVATAAGIGRSTATKTLVALASDVRVQRTTAGRDGARRLPDLWSAATQPATAERRKRATGDGATTKTPTTRSKTSGTQRTAAARSDGAARLGRGELTGQVLDFLQAHPGAHSPGHVAAGLGGRSAGAVSNALARLVDRKQAALTQDKPRRYTAAGR